MGFALENRTILITSNESWGEVWYSKQNYAFELSKKNRVVFINPAKSWKLKNLFTSSIKKEKYSDTLSIIDYKNFLPVRGFFLDAINNNVVSRRIKKWLKNNGHQDFIFWSFDPIRLYNHKLLGADYGIFHCVDFYNFQFRGEKILCETSDIILANTPYFLEKYVQFNKRKVLIPHAVSKDEFLMDSAELEKVSHELSQLGIKKDRFGVYVGTIDSRIDMDITEQIIKSNDHLSFVFIGRLNLPESDAAKRIFIDKIYSNVFILGTRPFKALKYYIANAKFCCLFMNMTHKGFTFQSHKTLLYLAQGKPVFCSRLSEYRALDELIYLFDSMEELQDKFSHFITHGEDEKLGAKRIEYARQFSYEKCLEKIESAINVN